MISPAALEEAVLSLLCFNTDQASVIAMKVTKELFTGKVNQLLAETVLRFISEYKTAPGTQLDYLLERQLRSGEEGKLLRKSLDLLALQAPQLNPEFVLDELDRFVEIKALSNNLSGALEALQQGELELARDTVYKFTAPKLNGDAGIWMNDPRQALRFLYRSEEHEEFFSTGVRALTDMGIKMERGTISIMIAPSGRGKTWWCTEVGKAGLMHHHPTLHITLELSEEKTARRYIQSIFSLSKDEAKAIKVPFFDKGPGGEVQIQFRDLARDSVFSKRKELFKKIEEMKSFPPLLVKEFPTSSLTIEQLDLFMDGLRRDQGFDPELVILDYPDLMRLNVEQLRVDTGRLYKSLRGLAMERNFALATVTQGNRASANARIVDNDNVSEDWSKIGTADLILTYNQTAAEKKLNLARMFVAKYRDGRDRFMVLLSQAYEFGQFSIDSVLMTAAADQQLEGLSNNSTQSA